jgi:hypothetical protein
MKLAIDGMLSGTGVRDLERGGYADPLELGIPGDLSKMLCRWVELYAEQHYLQFSDQTAVESLDAEGLRLAELVRAALPSAEVRYYSHARLEYRD